MTIAKVYVMWLHLIINTILPLIVLIILSTAIYRKLIKVKVILCLFCITQLQFVIVLLLLYKRA